MRRFFRRAAVPVLLALLLSLCGCSASGGIDQYFSLPQPAEEYLQLQQLIDQEIAAGSEYAAPVRGSYRQSVQLTDLDGDGIDEALVFLRDVNRNLKINIYYAVAKEYRQVLSVEGEGRAIGSIDFADMDCDGHTDLLVAWQIAAGMNLLSVYSLRNWTGELLLSTDSSEFLTGDLNSDGREDLLVIRGGNPGMVLADMYTFSSDREPQAASAALSAGIYELRRLRMVKLSGGTPSLMVESSLDNGDLVTDLLVCREGSLINLTLNRGTGVSETRRSYSLIYAQDIDGDGVTEIPHPRQLYSQGNEVYWSIAWYRYDSFGRASITANTYHCVSDGWYFVLPVGWETGLTVRRDDSIPGERAVILSRLGTDGNVNDLLIIYTITGENRSDRAKLGDRFILLEDNATIYAAQVLDDSLTQEATAARFNRIFTEWSSGSV